MSAVACLLLPLAGAADSNFPDNGQRATAHLMFKIVIPEVLSVETGETLKIGSNHQNVFQLAMGGTAAERRQIILSASGHRSVAQFAACSRSVALRGNPVINCTVSMP